MAGQWIRLDLRTKLLVFAGLIAVLPLVSAGQSLIRIAKDEVKSAANEQLVATAREVADQVDDIYARAWLAPLLVIRRALESQQLGPQEKIAVLKDGIAELPDIVSLQLSIEGGKQPLVVTQDRFAARLQQAGIEPMTELRRSPQTIARILGWTEADAGVAAPGAQDHPDRLLPRLGDIRRIEPTDDWLVTVAFPLETRINGARAMFSARINLDRVRRYIASQPLVATGRIVVADAAGKLIFDSTPSAVTSAILEKARSVDSSSNRIVTVEPYKGPDGIVLGAFSQADSLSWTVVVEKSEHAAYRAVEDMVRSLGWWLAGGLAVAAVAAAVLAQRISRPIKAIGEAANAVARGDFQVRVTSVKSRDEIGELAQRMNNMIVQIAERFQLARFVSVGTIDAIRAADAAGVQRGGVRRNLAILFADIRGYTAFSERHDPETVVDVLNSYLQHQADLVTEHHGDIDKFVGDQIMAVFSGPDRCLNAAACSVAIQERMEELAREHPEWGLAVGIGVDVGDVVAGAVGANHRLDFTVLGDHVNLAARLCSAAKPQEVLVSADVVAGCPGDAAIDFAALEPISVKGKSAPIPIFAARKRPVEVADPPPELPKTMAG